LTFASSSAPDPDPIGSLRRTAGPYSVARIFVAPDARSSRLVTRHPDHGKSAVVLGAVNRDTNSALVTRSARELFAALAHSRYWQIMAWPGRVQRLKATAEQGGEASKLKELTMHTHQKSSDPVATIGLDKNTFHLVGLDKRGAIAMHTKVSRNQLVRQLANLSPCLIGLEACSGSHHIARQIKPLGHDVRLIPAQYVKPFLKGHKNDYRDAEAIAEAVQRPTMNFVAIKTPEQSDLLSLHRVRSRLVRQRTAIINQIRGFLIERGITVRQGPGPLRKVLPVWRHSGLAANL
jgi:hypothetical protein